MPREQIFNAGLASDVARVNLLTNGGLDVWQRGNGPFTASGAFSADRWALSVQGTDTLSVTKNTVNVDVGSVACAACVFTFGTGAGSSALFQQLKAADGHQFGGRTLTVSVRIRSSVANAVRIGLFRDGTGANTFVYSGYHSGSGAYETLTATAFFPTDWTYCQVNAFFSAAGTHYVDSTMLVPGATSVDYVPLHPADDLARCFRYYEKLGVDNDGALILGGYSGAASIAMYATFPYKAVKAVAPTVTIVGTWNVSNAGQPVILTAGLVNTAVRVIATAAGAYYAQNTSGATNNLVVEANP